MVTYFILAVPVSKNQLTDILVLTNKTRKVITEDLVFLWGFRAGMTVGVLKKILHASHDVFSEDFEVKLVDKSCVVVVF
uniref:Uncharacterized protein n=1 Tax=Nelumbo nucifera TaxID=4432 RepID=A0A822YZA0_NELNU|nr:TPA_asm: hypothetical protein HUJ06_007220 [Nelumbo nucifera]